MPTNQYSSDFAVKQRLLQSNETFATTAHAILLNQYGEEIYDWDPLTVALEVKDDFKADIAPVVMDRWCAMQIVMGSDSFFKRIDSFLAICNTLADGQPFFDEFNPVTSEEAAWTIAEVGMNRDMLPFSYTIQKYLKTILSNDGFSEGNYPAIFEEVFEAHPSSKDIRIGMAEVGNNGNIGRYIREQLKDMRSQFDQIPGMQKLDEKIIEKGL